MAFVGRLQNLDLSRSCYPSYGAPTLTPVGLSPTGRASLRWTHNDCFSENGETSAKGGSWPVSDRRLRSPTGLGLYTSVCSAISKASSTSMPRYLTVLSSLLCPSSSWTTRRF